MKTFETLKSIVVNKTARQVLFTKHHSPKILFVAGTIGVVGAVVLACRATLKVDEVIDNGEKALKADIYTDEEEQRKFENRIKVQTALSIAKLYLPSAGLLIGSVAALTGSHVILTKRNGAILASYAVLDRAFKEYRQRVSDEYGEDVDRKFIFDAQPRVIEEKTAEGTTKTTTKNSIIDPYGRSPYTEAFDERSRFWSKEPGMNAQIVQMKQNWANDKLRAQGHLYLNEVLDMLGLPRTKAGTLVGWVYRHDGEPKTGDNYISFGVFEGDPEWVDAFIGGDEKYVTLDFNVDGVITDILFPSKK